MQNGWLGRDPKEARIRGHRLTLGVELKMAKPASELEDGISRTGVQFPASPLTMSDKDNPVVLTYKATVSVPVLTDEQKMRTEFNKAWGFKDGRVNILNSKGECVALPGADGPALIEAHYNLVLGYQQTVTVNVYKDGTRRIVEL